MTVSLVWLAAWLDDPLCPLLVWLGLEMGFHICLAFPWVLRILITSNSDLYNWVRFCVVLLKPRDEDGLVYTLIECTVDAIVVLCETGGSVHFCFSWKWLKYYRSQKGSSHMSGSFGLRSCLLPCWPQCQPWRGWQWWVAGCNGGWV